MIVGNVVDMESLPWHMCLTRENAQGLVIRLGLNCSFLHLQFVSHCMRFNFYAEVELGRKFLSFSNDCAPFLSANARVKQNLISRYFVHHKTFIFLMKTNFLPSIITDIVMRVSSEICEHAFD